MKICSECGAEAGNYDKFCTKCGSNFYITCSECGTQLDKSATFCSECGTRCQADDDVDFDTDIDFDMESLPETILSVAGQALLTLFMLDD